MSLEHIRIVAVRTFHPGNIGAIARAMKNMGLSNLVLVEPRQFPDQEATSRAAGAVDILENTLVVNSISEAIEDCQLVFATSARRRGFEWPMIDSREGAKEALALSSTGQNVAILFGPERSGLESHELRMANKHIFIPANPEYDVLNVSAAAQLIAYELWMQSTQVKDISEMSADKAYPSHEQMEFFYTHLEQVFKQTGFIVPQHPGNTMVKLRRLFNRARPEKNELNILRGMLSSVTNHINTQEK